MSVQYAPSKLRVPDGFNNLLEGLAREVLREQPENITKFAAQHFKTQLLLRDQLENGVNGSAVAEPTPIDEKPKDEPPKDETPNAETPKEEAKPESPAPAPAEASATEGEASATEGEASEATEPENEAKNTLSEDDAAIKIQAVLRGKKAREEVKAMKSGDKPETEESATEPETAAEESTVEETKPEEPAAENVPAAEDESSPEEQEAAALKIQAGFRGMKARKEVEALKSDKPETDTQPAAESAAPTSDAIADN